MRNKIEENDLEVKFIKTCNVDDFLVKLNICEILNLFTKSNNHQLKKLILQKDNLKRSILLRFDVPGHSQNE